MGRRGRRVVGQKHLENGQLHMVQPSRPRAFLFGFRPEDDFLSSHSNCSEHILKCASLSGKHCFLRSGIQINKNPHQKGKLTAASGESSGLGFFLALPPGCLPPQTTSVGRQEAKTGVLAD